MFFSTYLSLFHLVFSSPFRDNLPHNLRSKSLSMTTNSSFNIENFLKFQIRKRPKMCYTGMWLFWAEGNWRKAGTHELSTFPSLLRAEHELFLWKWMTTLSLEMKWGKSLHEQTLPTSPHLPLVPPDTRIPRVCCPGLKVLCLCLNTSLQMSFSSLRGSESLNSNHPIWITHL